jgi:NAD(P)-dependent dehydrogenase (short-subunit alcohol dehydrogenase family)
MNKTILITGSSTGLGKAAARHFAEQGWNVIASMRNPEREQDLTRYERVLINRLDVQDAASIATCVQAGITRFGRIDVLVNNAGFGLFGIFESTPVEKIREQFDVNVFGAMDVTRAILPHFRQHKSGVILNVSSGVGVFTLPMLSLYCASKFALEGFSEALAYELAPLNIIVKLIEPGGVVSTNFGKRSAAEASRNGSIPDYDRFVANTNSLFEKLRSSRAGTEAEVANIIFAAATDGTDRLRYVATDDIKPLVQARRETSEDHYISTLKSQFSQLR